MPCFLRATSKAEWYTLSEYPGPREVHMSWAIASMNFKIKLVLSQSPSYSADNTSSSIRCSVS